MIKKVNIIKRICAGILSAVMITSLLPVEVLATTNQVDEEIDAVVVETVDEYAEETTEPRNSVFDLEESIEAETYNVEIEVNNVKSFDYAVASNIENAPVVTFKNATPSNGIYTINGIAKDSYILVKTINAADKCTNPKMLIGTNEASKVPVTFNGSLVNVWCTDKITENIDHSSDVEKRIYIKAQGERYNVSVSTENVDSLKYRIYTYNDSYIVAEDETSAIIENGIANIEVEKGYSLAITEITPSYDYGTPVVSAEGSEIFSGKIGNIDDTTSLNGYNIGVINEYKYVSAICEPSVEYTVDMNLNNVSAVECTIYTKKDSTNVVKYVKDATISDNVATVKVPKDCYLALSNISFNYPDDPERNSVKKGNELIQKAYIDCVGDVYDIGKITENISKDDANKIVIESLPPVTMHEVKIPVQNIKSLQFIVYTDSTKITSDCLINGTIVTENGNKYAKVLVAEGSTVAINADKIIKMDDGDYLSPYVENNGVVKSVETVGKYVTSTSATDIKGYKLGKVKAGTGETDANNISNSYKVIADAASYEVNITAVCASSIKYRIYKNSDYSDSPVPEEQTVDVNNIGVDKKGITIDVPANQYLVITEVSPMSGCHGDEAVTNGSNKLTKGKVTNGFEIGKITKNIKEGITAEIKETSYDVDIKIPYDAVSGTTKPKSVKYVITGDINSVNATTEVKEIEYADSSNDGIVKIEVEKNKYLVITDVVLDEGKAARATINFTNSTVDKNGKLVGTKQPINYGKVGTYTSGAFLNGWNIGKVINPKPLADEQGGKTSVLEAKCYNYCMYTELQKSENLNITYKAGTTSEVVSGQTRYSVKVKDTGNAIVAEPLVLHIEEDNKPFSSNVIKAYAINEYTSDKSEDVELETTEDTGNFALSADKILAWTKDAKQYTKIVIVCESNKNIVFPTVSESDVKIYKYVEGKKASEYSEETVLNADGENTIAVPYNSIFQFVVIPVYADDFEVKSVTKEYGAASLKSENKTLADESIITCYTLQGVQSEVKISTLLKTKSTADVKYTVNNQTSGEATFTSSNSSTTSEPNVYKVQTGVDFVLFNITVDKSIEPKVVYGYEKTEIKAFEYKDEGDKRKYSYKILAKDVNAETLTITKTGVVRDFYLQAKDNEIDVIVSYNGSPIEEIEESKPAEYNKGFTVHHYLVPYGKTVNVQAIPWRNCKLTSATINYGTQDAQNDKTVQYGAEGVIKYSVKDNNSKLGRDFVLGSKALTTLYVSDDYKEAYIDDDSDPAVFVQDNLIPIANNSYTVDVRKNLKTYRAAILDGNEAIAMDSSNIRYEAKVGSTVVTNDVIVGIENYKERDLSSEEPEFKTPETKGLLVFDFEKPSVAGKTVDVAIYRGSTVLGKIKFKVSPYLETVTLGGSKNNAISQEYLSEKTYKIAYNSGVKVEDVAFTCEYYNISTKEWVRFQTTQYVKNEDNNVWEAKTVMEASAPTGAENLIKYYQASKSLKIAANKSTLEALAKTAGYKSEAGSTAGLPKIRLNFYDVTDKDFDIESYGGCVLKMQKEFTFTLNTLRGITPAALFLSASDTYLNIGLTAPKQYTNYKDSLYYVVKAEAIDRYNTKFPADKLLPEKTVIVPMTEVAAKVDLAAEGITPGKGDAWNYKVTVTIGAYDKDFVDAYNNNPSVVEPSEWQYYEHSKDKVISKVSTKAPYYETKIKATAKTNKIYQGQKNIQVAQATFDKKTTFYNLELRMYPKGTSLERALDTSMEPIAWDSSVAEEAMLSQDVNNPARILLDSTGIKPGEYVLYITPEADGRASSREAYASSASIAITIYESINGLTKDGEIASFGVSVPTTTLYRKDNATATMTASAVFSNKPKSTKVTWKIEGVEGATNDITKYVTINSKGKITVSKNFKYEANQDKVANNKFRVYAEAADYTSDTKRISTKSAEVTVRPHKSEVTGLKLMLDNADAYPDSDGKYVSNAINAIYAYGVDIKDCTVKSSNTKIIAIGDIKDSNTRYLSVKGTGKARITVTCNDGGKSSKYIDVTIKNKSFDKGLGLLINDYDDEEGILASYRDGLNKFNQNYFIKLNVMALVGDEGEREAINNLTSYNLKVSSGGKLYTTGVAHEYLLIPYANTTKLVLTDNTKNKKTEALKYSQTIIINNTLFNVSKLSAGLTKTSFKPREAGGVLKITGFPKGTDLSTLTGYKVALVPDYTDYNKNKDRYDAFIEKALSLVDSSGSPVDTGDLFDLYSGVELKNSTVYKNALVADAILGTVTGKDYGEAIGKYKFNAYMLGSDGRVNAIASLPIIQLKAADKPKFDLIGGYTAKKVSGSIALLSVDYSKSQMSKVNSWKVVDVKDANISGAINNKFSNYYTADLISDDEQHGKIKVTAKETVSALDYNQNIYADVTYKYEDLAGKDYYVTKRIYIKSIQ